MVELDDSMLAITLVTTLIISTLPRTVAFFDFIASERFSSRDTKPNRPSGAASPLL
jgi:hypothetical protein